MRFRRFAAFVMLSIMPLAAHASGNLLVAYFSAGALLIQLALLPLFWRGNGSRRSKWVATCVYLACAVAAWAFDLQQPANRLPEISVVLLAFAPAGLTALVVRFMRSSRS